MEGAPLRGPGGEGRPEQGGHRGAMSLPRTTLYLVAHRPNVLIVLTYCFNLKEAIAAEHFFHLNVI